MISRRQTLLATLAGVSACGRKRGAGYNGYAFVACEAGRAVAAVDLTAFAVTKHIRFDDAPTDLAAHPAKPLIYVLTPATGTLHEIDTRSLSVKRRLSLGGTATAMRPEAGGRAVWVISASGRRLLRVPLDDLRVSNDIRLPLAPTHFDLSEWTGRAAVSDAKSGTVSLVDLRTGSIRAPLQLGSELGEIRFRNDGESVLVANRQKRQLTVLDAQAGRVMVHLPLAIRPDHFCVHPNGGQLFITGEGRDAVVIVYPYYVPEVAETVLAGSQPGPMAATDTNLFVTNPSAGAVTIMNIERRRVIAVAAVGTGPGCVVVTPGNEYALVLNQTSGDMAVIRILGIQPDRRKTAPLFTMIPLGSRPVGALITAV